MHTENIIAQAQPSISSKDIHDLIHDVKQLSSRVYSDRREADRTFTRVVEDQEGTLESYNTVSEGLVDASQALDRVDDDLFTLEERLRTLISNIEMETLSHKVQSK